MSSESAVVPIVVSNTPPTTFWNQPFVQNAVPFLTSLAIHAGVVAAGLLTVKAIEVATGGPVEYMATPVESVFQEAPVGQVVDQLRFRGPGDNEFIQTFQDQDPTASPDSLGWNTVHEVDLDSFAAGPEGEGDSANPVIGLGFGPGPGRGNEGRGPGDGGRGGPLAPFGAPQTGGSRGTIFPHNPKDQLARSVAYVCDGSGSMLENFDDLRSEIHRSVVGLKPIQAFNVIFFKDDDAAIVSEGGLLLASPKNKAAAAAFLDEFSPSGTTDPIPGLKLAFQQKPELIWLLTDGDFPDNQAVINFIRQQNASKRVQINTIAFVNRGEEYEKVLQTIADENRGKSFYVGESELRR